MPKSSIPLPAAASGSPSLEAMALPEHSLMAQREVEPSANAPLAYREYAYFVNPGGSLSDAERLLWSKIQEVMRALEKQHARKFVQLAVFDHKFTTEPERAPLATLVWKDWKGAPVLIFPSDPARTSQWPFGSAGLPQVSVPPLSTLPAVAADAARGAPSVAGGLNRSSVAQRSRDPIADLVSELFDKMHELSFCRGVTEGADFVLEVASKMIPSKYCLIHVFDINVGDFVLVRAKGENQERVLLSRIPDREPWIDTIMRRPVPTRLKGDLASQPRWRTLGAVLAHAVAVPVHVGGRYLGLIELADPADGGEFFENEVNALAYIAERFAEFLTNRPIVLDPEVVLSNRPLAR